jgi:hypothetical protein
MMSSMHVRVVGFAAAYPDIEHAELAFCLSGATCGTAAIRVLDGDVECRADASLNAPDQQCMLEPGGTLLIMIELDASPSKLHGEHALTLELSGSGLEPVTGDAVILLKPFEGNGEGCGVSHVFGGVTVDAELTQAVTG